MTSAAPIEVERSGSACVCSRFHCASTRWVGEPLAGDSPRGVGKSAAAGGSGFVGVGDALALGSSAAYNRSFTRNLTGRVAVAVNYLDSEVSAEDLKSASALVGLRYGF